MPKVSFEDIHVVKIMISAAIEINDSIIFKKLLKCEFGRVTKTYECKYHMQTSAVIKMNQRSIFMTFATKKVCHAY
jgi:hypothetical protein